MAYEERPLGRQKQRRNSDNDDHPLIYQLIVDGAKVTPTSAKLGIYRDGVSTAVLATGTAMVVSGTLLTYSLDTTTTATFLAGTYRADIIVTYNSKTYDKHIKFDVVAYLFDSSIGFDQLVALDDSVQGMMHDGDPAFAALIEACKTIVQTKIEAKAINDGRLLQEMIIDHSGIAVVERFYMLHRIHLNKGNLVKSEQYKNDFDELFAAVLSTIKYDTGQTGDEPAEIGGVEDVRFVT